MPKKRRIETEHERMQRLQKLAQELRGAGTREDDAMEAMVRESIERHGP